MAEPGVTPRHAAKAPSAIALIASLESLFIARSPNATIPDGFTPTARLRCGGVSWRLDGRRRREVSAARKVARHSFDPLRICSAFQRRISRGRGFRRRSRPQVTRAVGAVFIVLGDFLFALRAG